MKYSLVIVTFLILFNIQGFCQTVPDGQIKVYDSYQPKKGKSVGEKNKISINPLGVIIGDYPLYYERMFGTTFSIELGAGVTYQNYTRPITDLYGNANYSSLDVTRSYQLGSTYSVSSKIYLEDDCFEGSYLALCYRNRVYKDEVTAYQGGVLATPMKESQRLNSFTFNYGYVFHLGKGIMLDYYVGIGLRTVTSSEFTSTYNSSSSYPYTSTYTYSTENKKTTNPTGMMGLKIGYAF